MSTPSFVVFSTPEDPATVPDLRAVIAGDDTEIAMRVASTLEEGITSGADVLILFIGESQPPELTDDLGRRLKERRS